MTDSAGTFIISAVSPVITVFSNEPPAKDGYILDDTPQTVKVKSNDVITCYDELLSIIHELTDYTVTHFADEEAYMEKIGYEGLAAQKNAHASFVARLESINLIELDENPQKYMESLIEFLLGWLINHILYSDKKIPVQA